MKTSLRWIFIGYLAAILVCFAWKARFVVAASVTSTDSIFPAPATNNSGTDLLDRKIIADAIALLQNDTRWTQNDDEFCVPGRPLTLYCALAIAAKSNGLNITPGDSFTLRVTDVIKTTVSDNADFSRPAEQPYSAIFAFNNHPKSDRDAVLGILRRALKPESSQ